MAQIKHPAKFTDEIVATAAAMFAKAGLSERARVLDPFAGTGRCHGLPQKVLAFEIEPEWAALHPDTKVGSVLALPRFAPVDAVFTSPCYGNRMADATLDTSKWHRMTYRVALGRDLHEDNSAGMPWGERYRAFHVAAWSAVTQRVKLGAWFILNIKDHVRYEGVRPVSAWHLSVLCGLGWTWMGAEAVQTPGYRKGTNRNSRLDHEWLLLLRYDTAGTRPNWRP